MKEPHFDVSGIPREHISFSGPYSNLFHPTSNAMLCPGSSWVLSTGLNPGLIIRYIISKWGSTFGARSTCLTIPIKLWPPELRWAMGWALKLVFLFHTGSVEKLSPQSGVSLNGRSSPYTEELPLWKGALPAQRSPLC